MTSGVRTTRDLVTVLRRAAAILPDGEVEAAARGRYRIKFRRPNGKMITQEGHPARCLYTAVIALTTDPRFGGYGDSMETVRAELKLHPAGIPRRGLSPHETKLLRALAV